MALGGAQRILTTHVGSLPRPDDVAELLAAKEFGEDYDAEAIDVQAGPHQLAAHSVPRVDEVDVIVHHHGVRRCRPRNLGCRPPSRSEQHQPTGSLAHEAARSRMLHSRATSSVVVHGEPIDTRMKRSEPRLEPIRKTLGTELIASSNAFVASFPER